MNDPTQADRFNPQTAITFASAMASERISTGDLAQLRRMNPKDPGPPAFWKLTAGMGISRNQELAAKWALIVKGIALMTSRTAETGTRKEAHDYQTPVGRALFQGNDPKRDRPLYSEQRLGRLLNAKGNIMTTLLVRAFHIMANEKAAFNWEEMARLVLNEGRHRQADRNARNRIADFYYTAASLRQTAENKTTGS